MAARKRIEVGVELTTSQWDDEEDYDGTSGEGKQRSKGNSLREKLEAALAENKTLKERVDKAEATARQATVSALVKEKGLDPKVTKLMPSTIEPTDEAISAWLDEFGDLFAVKTDDREPPKSTGDAGAEEDGEELDEYGQAMRQLQSLQAGSAAPAKQQDVLAKLQDPNLTRDQLLQMVNAAGGGYGVG